MKKIIFSTIVSFFAFSTFAKSSKNHMNINTITADSTEFRDYLGSYKMDENPIAEKMKIFFKDDNLYGQAVGYPATKLTRKKEDEFEETNFGAVITFTRVNGIVSGIKVSVQGQDLLGTKE
ncbi:hypothetical protein VB796_03210 [Arcicella sp. LKC2W]|uniref:hypothetical protein n=1 Tax=Arcicella sp. LKC2W TaxID=2984198 RepID=UPI002B207540|nr:hypothetical protein [Arcicella sp. LKC2W]MEA5458026.1 hypothetical protein [Arcicella sp. LKC2W]